MGIPGRGIEPPVLDLKTETNVPWELFSMVLSKFPFLMATVPPLIEEASSSLISVKAGLDLFIIKFTIFSFFYQYESVMILSKVEDIHLTIR